MGIVFWGGHIFFFFFTGYSLVLDRKQESYHDNGGIFILSHCRCIRCIQKPWCQVIDIIYVNCNCGDVDKMRYAI